MCRAVRCVHRVHRAMSDSYVYNGCMGSEELAEADKRCVEKQAIDAAGCHRTGVMAFQLVPGAEICTLTAAHHAIGALSTDWIGLSIDWCRRRAGGAVCKQSRKVIIFSIGIKWNGNSGEPRKMISIFLDAI